MPINFPDSPAENDSFTSGGKKWIYNGAVWTLITANAYTIPTGEVTTDKIATGAVHEVKLASAAVTAAKLASGAAVANIGYTPANVASPTFTGTVVLPSTTSIGTVSSTEIGYVDGVTSAIQTQLDSKLTATTAVTSGRNSAINGDFKFWQRGTTVAIGTNNYLADRWGMNRGSYAAGATASRQLTSDTTNLPNIQYCIRAQRDSGNTSTEAIFIWQAFESTNVKRFLGKTVTMSFYARVGANYSAASSNLNAILYGSTNATDVGLNSATGLTALGNRFSSVTTTWVRYSFTATVTTSITQLFLTFSHTPVGTAGANDYFEVTGVQLEEGAVATPFEFEDFGTTLAKCQRYFEKSYNIGTTPGTASTLDESIGLGVYTNTPAAYNRIGSGVFFKVPKRATPTIVQYAPATGSTAAASNATNGDGSTAVGYVSAQQPNQNGFNIAASIGGSTSTGYFTIFYAYTASAEL